MITRDFRSFDVVPDQMYFNGVKIRDTAYRHTTGETLLILDNGKIQPVHGKILVGIEDTWDQMDRKARETRDDLDLLAEGRLLDDDGDPMTINDYLEDCLSIDEYRTYHDGSYKGCDVLMAWGGPSMWIDTDAGEVKTAWWGPGPAYAMSKDAVETVDEWAQMFAPMEV